MLQTLIGSKLRAKVLGWLFTHPDERYFVRQLTKLLAEDSTNLSRELLRLEKTGILVSTQVGKQRYYQANRKSPVFNELHGLTVKTAGLADILRAALAPLANRIRLAFIFGSVAGGGEKRTSDIDLMVVGDVSFGDLVSYLSPAERTLGREINSVVYPESEFRQKLKQDHHFIQNVLHGEKISLIGNEDELRRLAE